MKNFKGLKIWQKGFAIAIRSYDLVKSFPSSERFGLSQQITSAAVSIPCNIAEGCGRSSIKDQCRFMEIALGSSFELETQVLIAKAVQLGSTEINDLIIKDLDEEQKMLMSYIVKLKG